MAVGFLAVQYQSGSPLLRGGAVAQALDATSADVASQDVAMVALTPGMRGVAEHLARKYRVSSMAMEPLVGAAQEAGNRVGLDPLLILAVMAVESRFNPFAESVVGAQGLMQVIPKFHQDKIGEAGDEALLDPVKNIEVGALVLKESIRRMGGLETGLQQYAGALSDSSSGYTNKVLAIKRELEQAMRRGKSQVREASLARDPNA
jgi:soluble lytic murein transglycosylase-like protein